MKIRFNLNSISFIEFAFLRESARVMEEFSAIQSSFEYKISLNYYAYSLILGYVKKREMASAKSREQKKREVDRCGCQTGLSEECEIRVLLRETGGRFKDGNIFRHRTIFTFAYITFYVYTLRRCVYISRVYYLYLYFMLWERNIGIGEINDFDIAASMP